LRAIRSIPEGASALSVRRTHSKTIGTKGRHNTLYEHHHHVCDEYVSWSYHHHSHLQYSIRGSTSFSCRTYPRHSIPVKYDMSPVYPIQRVAKWKRSDLIGGATPRHMTVGPPIRSLRFHLNR